MQKINKGGGLQALKYSFRVAKRTGFMNLAKAVLSKNTCKACAFGTGGQNGGYKNEANNGIEICKKSFQAQLTDIQPAIQPVLLEKSIQDFRKMSGRELEQLGRLNFPLYKQKGDTHYQVISYEKAFERITQKMKETDPARSFFYTSGRSSNEAAFITQLFARLYGTNHVNNCSYYCHQASGEGLMTTLGTGTATIQFEDLENADLIFVIGANPASNHPRFITSLLHCRRRGGKVVVVNPLKETGLVKFAVPSDWRSMLGGGSDIASDYVQPNVGSDIAFLKGIAKFLIENKHQNQEFIENFTAGFSEYKQDIEATSWDEIVQKTGLEKNIYQHIGNLYAQSKNTIFAWGMGLTHHLHGVGNVESVANLAILRGMLGRKNAGLLPLRGHSNVQGVGSMGVTPKLKTAIFNNLETLLNVKLPTMTGMDTMACMEASYAQQVDFAFLLGGNLYASNPDSEYAHQALNRIPFKVFLNPTLNLGHFYGIEQEVIILPVRVRDEEKQATTQESMFNFVRLSDGGIARFVSLKTETEIIATIASQVVPTTVLDFKEFMFHDNIRKAIAKVITGFEKIEHIAQNKEEFQITGRTFHKAVFGTSDQKAHFRVVPTPTYLLQNQEFMLSTLRSEGQFNSIIYEEKDLYRNQTERWIVLMNPVDMAEKGLKENDQVNLYNETGRMEKLKVRAFEIKKGNLAAYYPEANILVPRQVDERSKTPAFKSVKVVLEKV